MIKRYIIVNPWTKDLVAGDIFETSELHLSLFNHVVEIKEQPVATDKPTGKKTDLKGKQKATKLDKSEPKDLEDK